MSKKSKEEKEKGTELEALTSVTVNFAAASSSCAKSTGSSSKRVGFSKLRKDMEALVLESDDEELLDDEIIQSVRRMGIRPLRHFDPKRDTNFESWLARV